MDKILDGATRARAELPPPGDERYDRYCEALADELSSGWADVLAANATDVAQGTRAGLGPELVDRLALGKRRLDELVDLIARTRVALPTVTAPTLVTGPAMAPPCAGCPSRWVWS
ncbi:hypothetical protein [Salinispora arenicola]|uniref:hypothetical protein n=1 Tax=Salinispora arenicola TaxID=168697 RepID=UPI0027DE1BD5|nr:hypothetical protein [Salinispora arenicola]